MVRAKNIKRTDTIDFFGTSQDSKMELPFVGGVSAGFPSPADDFMDMTLDLNQELIKNPNATFYGRVRGNSMIGADLNDGDVLVIDRSAEPVNNAIAVCYIDGGFTVKRLNVTKTACYLVPENKEFDKIKITEDNEFIIWGIVTYVIKKITP